MGRPGQAQGGEQAERDGLAVAEPIVGRSLQRVREGVPEIERLPLAVLVRVANADRRLECGAAADELLVGKLPERLAGEQARLHDLGQSFRALLPAASRAAPGR